MSFVRFTPVMRFYWDVFRFSYAGHTFLSVCLAFDHACCLPHSAKQNGLRYVPFLFRRGSGSPVARSRIVGAVIGFRGFTSGLCVSLWRSQRRTKGTRRTESAARQSAFCVNISALPCFPRGVRWGCAPQTCAKESSTLWTLFTLRRGWVSAGSRPLCAFA